MNVHEISSFSVAWGATLHFFLVSFKSNVSIHRSLIHRRLTSVLPFYMSLEFWWRNYWNNPSMNETPIVCHSGHWVSLFLQHQDGGTLLLQLASGTTQDCKNSGVIPIIGYLKHSTSVKAVHQSLLLPVHNLFVGISKHFNLYFYFSSIFLFQQKRQSSLILCGFGFCFRGTQRGQSLGPERSIIQVKKCTKLLKTFISIKKLETLLLQN